LRPLYLAVAVAAAANLWLADGGIVAALALACVVVCVVAVAWPVPVPPPFSSPTPRAPVPPPPPPPQRDTAVCAGCGRAVDATWAMCPYCSHRLSM